MGTPFTKVYEAFFSKLLEDEWSHMTMDEIEYDLQTILDGAIVWFKFPRVSLEKNETGFVSELSNDEIQIIATYMKCEWLNRSIMTWENIKTLYEERDFSQANLLDKLTATLEKEEKKAAKLESTYYRAIKGKPFNYSKLAGE